MVTSGTQMATTTVMPTKSMETTAQSSTSWKPTSGHGNQLLTLATLHEMGFMIPATEAEHAGRTTLTSLTTTLMDQEANLELTPKKSST